MSQPAYYPINLKLKCTTCKKVSVAEPHQISEAQAMGCFFSACCHAVATVERVAVKKSKS